MVFLGHNITTVEPNPDQPRKEFEPGALQELADSIREQGVLQPLLVEAWAWGPMSVPYFSGSAAMVAAKDSRLIGNFPRMSS